MFTSLVAFSLVFLLYWRRKRLASNPKCLPLPPGPKGLPLLGNVFRMPSTHYWLTYTDWARQHGDIVYADICGYDMIFINSAEVAMDLLERRSSVYSDRPRFPMMNELMDFTWSFSLMKYGPTWRQHRKTFHQHFHQGAALKHVPIQVAEALKCLSNLLREPQGFMRHARQFFSASIFRVTYGLDVKDADDPYISVAEEVMEGATVAGIPGAFLVDMLPILKYMPSWFPGASFQKTARQYRELRPSILNDPVDAVIKSMESGSYSPSMVSDFLKRLKNAGGNSKQEQADLEVIKNAAAIAFAAGADTTVSTLQTLFLALLLHPDVQKRAHEEITKVIGPDRLPEYEDMESIPYVQAIIKELMQWQPAAPLGLPHRVETNDEYRGYHIPKGSTVVGNIWAILHDDRIYADPYTFRPERFLNSDGTLNKDVPDPTDYVFGFGRRGCPGRHHAYNGALIMAASIIAAFDIRPTKSSESMKPYGESREDISISLMTSGLISHPRTFECTITPRSDIISKQILEANVSTSSSG